MPPDPNLRAVEGDRHNGAAPNRRAPSGGRSVAEAAYDALRQRGATVVFANPGSTEIPLLKQLPDDFTFVLGLHEASVVGMATGYAIANDAPAVVLLHTTAGLGNAVGALATARVNRVPLVVIVGQQDRRHLALEPFLAGHLEGLGGTYPVWSDLPALAADVPGALARAWGEAVTAGGPAVVVVPMDDWEKRAGEDAAAPARLALGNAPSPGDVDDLAGLLASATRPLIVTGAGADSEPAWEALIVLADRLDCDVWQEAFGARAGFPQNHPRFAGHLPASRSQLRRVLADHDVVLVVGAPAFRLYPYEPGPLVPAGVRVAVVTAWADEALHSPAELALIGSPATAIEGLLARLAPRRPDRPSGSTPDPSGGDSAGGASPGGGQLSDVEVLDALRSRLPADTVLVEEAPSAKPMLHQMIPARRPLGFLSAAMGGLGFGLPAAAGVKLGSPDRPVVAVLGDGSALYAIQGLWSAAHYGIGVLYIVLSNGRYAVMDQIAASRRSPWPPFEEVSMAGLAESLGCRTLRIDRLAQLEAVLDDVLPALHARRSPLLLDVGVGVPVGRQADGAAG